MGFCHLTLSAPKPLPPEYPKELRTIGDHLRMERLKRGLEQKHVAAMFGVNVLTISTWEVGRRKPKVSYLPRIIEFLGYDPFPGAKTLGERLRTERQRRGLTQVKLAQQLGTRSGIVSLLETGKEISNQRLLARVRQFLGEGGGV